MKIPEWSDCSEKDEAGADPLTALEKLVLDNEPGDGTIFREQLQAAIDEVAAAPHEQKFMTLSAELTWRKRALEWIAFQYACRAADNARFPRHCAAYPEWSAQTVVLQKLVLRMQFEIARLEGKVE